MGLVLVLAAGKGQTPMLVRVPDRVEGPTPGAAVSEVRHLIVRSPERPPIPWIDRALPETTALSLHRAVLTADGDLGYGLV
jgi:hypothetical protein